MENEKENQAEELTLANVRTRAQTILQTLVEIGLPVRSQEVTALLVHFLEKETDVTAEEIQLAAAQVDYAEGLVEQMNGVTNFCSALEVDLFVKRIDTTSIVDLIKRHMVIVRAGDRYMNGADYDETATLLNKIFEDDCQITEDELTEFLQGDREQLDSGILAILQWTGALITRLLRPAKGKPSSNMEARLFNIYILRSVATYILYRKFHAGENLAEYIGFINEAEKQLVNPDTVGKYNAELAKLIKEVQAS